MTEGSRDDGRMARRSIDFTSALYLGIRHSSRALRPWSQLTTGKPAALETAPAARATAAALARLQGCERTILLPSTLHLFFDLFEVLRRDGMRIYADAATYPTALWGAERARSRGAPLRPIAHYDARAARLAIEEDERTQLRPVIVADGFCPGCGRPAPLRDYLDCVIPYGGYVILDDTQALGVWGRDPGATRPYGSGGGGSLRLHSLQSPHVVLGSSLAKGFGVPLAALSGSARLIERFASDSETLVHASPPSLAALHATEHALAVNALRGDTMRMRLAKRVMMFQSALWGTELSAIRSVFPVQTVSLEREDEAVRLHQALSGAGIRTAILRGTCAPGARLAFIITASHAPGEIAWAADALAVLSPNLGTRRARP
jgi:8-amino-7-oxononanoate synthase